MAWVLNRQEVLPVLAGEWASSGDESYRTKANALLADWIANSPYPSRLSFSPQWRALEVAREDELAINCGVKGTRAGGVMAAQR